MECISLISADNETLELVKHDDCSDDTISIAKEAGESRARQSWFLMFQDLQHQDWELFWVTKNKDVADGVASAKDIDTAMVLGYKHPMGGNTNRPCWS